MHTIQGDYISMYTPRFDREALATDFRVSILLISARKEIQALQFSFYIVSKLPGGLLQWKPGWAHWNPRHQSHDGFSL